MKILLKLLIPLYILLGCDIARAQSSLPPCPKDESVVWNNCFGITTNASGDKYIGMFKDDEYTGQGTYTYANGDKYVGMYKVGKRNGQGTFTLASGDKYIGMFKDGKLDGQGTFTLASGDKYVGMVKDAEFNGQGTYTFASGDKYIGEFKDSKLNGQGIYTFADGSSKQEGIWENNKFIRAQSPPVVNQAPKTDPKVQKCKRLGLLPGTEDYKLCMK